MNRIRGQNLPAMNVLNGSTVFEPHTRRHYSRVVLQHGRDVENVRRRLRVDTGCVGEGRASFQAALTSIYTQLAGAAVSPNPAVTFKVLAENWMQDAFFCEGGAGGMSGVARGRRSPDMKLLSQEEGSGVGRL